MKKIIAITALILTFASISSSQTQAEICRPKCAAGPPYTPSECRSYCEENSVMPSLLNATVLEFRFFFNVSKESAEKLLKLNVELKKNGTLPTRELYTLELKEDGINFNQKFDSLDKVSTQYLLLPANNEIKIEKRAFLLKEYQDKDLDVFKREERFRKDIQLEFKKDLQKDLQKDIKKETLSPLKDSEGQK